MSGLFSRLGIVAWPFKSLGIPHALGARVVRWQVAVGGEPLLAEDIIDMGKLLAYGDVDETNRIKASALELAYDRGRRDFALDLLALMHLNDHEFNQLLKERHYDETE